MTSLSSSASTSAKTVNNNAQKNISVSVGEKNALTAVNGHKKRKQGRLRDFCIVFLSVVIAFCTGIMLFCGYAMTQMNQNRPNRPSHRSTAVFDSYRNKACTENHICIGSGRTECRLHTQCSNRMQKRGRYNGRVVLFI